MSVAMELFQAGAGSRAAAVASVDVSVIVPTLNEARNLPLLVPRIARALAGRSYEVIVVDDNSRDGTRDVCASLARDYPVDMIVREHPQNGLSGAVLRGLASARGRVLIVIDADLQHPPERIPDLVSAIESGAADFALGSRYVDGGSTGAGWSFFRRLNSRVATLLSRPFSGRVTDPMSGFFALSAETFRAGRELAPLGYKIGLELMCKCRVARVREVPIHFGVREHGASKLSLREQFRYLEHLSRLYDFAYPRLSPIVKFLITVALGCGLGGLGVAWASAAGCGLVGALAAGYAVAIAVTAGFHARYVRAQREYLRSERPWRDFVLISAGELAAVIGVGLWIGQRVVGPSYAEAALIAFAVATGVRYVLRKELLQDVRGLGPSGRASAPAARGESSR